MCCNGQLQGNQPPIEMYKEIDQPMRIDFFPCTSLELMEDGSMFCMAHILMYTAQHTQTHLCIRYTSHKHTYVYGTLHTNTLMYMACTPGVHTHTDVYIEWCA